VVFRFFVTVGRGTGVGGRGDGRGGGEGRLEGVRKLERELGC